MELLAHLIGGIIALPSCISFIHGYKDIDGSVHENLFFAFLFGTGIMLILY